MDLDKIYDNIAKSYDNKYQSAIHKIEDDIISHILTSQIKPSDSVLDLGCGTGHVITLANLNYMQYYGVDFSKGMIDDAKSKYNNYIFKNQDITKMDYIKYFNVILAIYGQVNYIGIKKFCDILNKHGNKNIKYMAVVYAKNGHEDYSYTQNYQNYFTKREIKESMLKEGYDACVRDFSFNGEQELTGQQQLERTLFSKEDEINNCKYNIISNFNIFKEA